jgi:hypothetical protein
MQALSLLITFHRNRCREAFSTKSCGENDFGEETVSQHPLFIKKLGFNEKIVSNVILEITFSLKPKFLIKK